MLNDRRVHRGIGYAPPEDEVGGEKHTRGSIQRWRYHRYNAITLGDGTVPHASLGRSSHVWYGVCKEAFREQSSLFLRRFLCFDEAPQDGVP
jgi:hypothetical protein